MHWSTVSEIERIDMVLIEFNVRTCICTFCLDARVKYLTLSNNMKVNDSFISDLPHALEDKGEDGKTRRETNFASSLIIISQFSYNT